jgi:hypothetical protein
MWTRALLFAVLCFSATLVVAQLNGDQPVDGAKLQAADESSSMAEAMATTETDSATNPLNVLVSPLYVFCFVLSSLYQLPSCAENKL